MKNVLLPVEIPNRELMYKTLLSIGLAEKGYCCHVSLKKLLPHIIENVSPLIYMDKGYHCGVSEKIHHSVKSKGGLIVGLDEEGAIDYEDFPFIETRYTEYVAAVAKLKTAVIARPLVVEAIQISKSYRLLQALRAFAMTKNGISRQRLCIQKLYY